MCNEAEQFVRLQNLYELQQSSKKNQIIARLDSFLSAHERNIDTSIQKCVFLILRKSTHLII